jgi:hypothetical protein
MPMGLAPSITASCNIGKEMFAALSTPPSQLSWTTGRLLTPATPFVGVPEVMARKW